MDLRRCFLFCSLCLPAAASDLFIRNATVIDTATGVARPLCSIQIHGTQIAEVGSNAQPSKQSRIVNGTGKFVIPGLWDMHVHLLQRDHLADFAAFGITGVRDMGGDFDHIKVWRDQILKKQLIGPHIESCGAPVDGFPSVDPKAPVRFVRDPADARNTYDRLDDQGVDFIAVLPRLPRDAYFALVERARKYYSAVAGAVPTTVSVLEAIEARQRSIDEMSGILLACSTEEKRLRGPRALALDRGDAAAFLDTETAAMESFSSEKAGAVFQQMALFETHAVPMLVKLRSSPDAKGLYDVLAQAVLRMHHAGVVIMAGSGAGTAGTHPGEDLHQELELLVAAGLTPAQALRSATLDPAKFLDAGETLGMVEQGRLADLVILDADPLADIRNTRKISAVILNGQYLPKTSVRK